jgi:hypothetical protein
VILAVVFAVTVQKAMSGGPRAAAKSKGRDIWLAIMSANMERETFTKGPLWPHEARLPVDQGGAGLTFTNATEYFKQLMAGSDPDHQLVSDLNPKMLSAGGYPSVTNALILTAKNIAWHVADVSCSFTNTDAFLISKDIAQVTRSGASNAPVVFSRSGPFKGEYVFWITRGGAVFDVHKKYVTKWSIIFPSTNNVPFLPD